MVKKLLCSTHDALYDVKWLKRKREWLDDELDHFKQLVEEKDIDSDYQEILHFILHKAKINKNCRRVRGNVTHIDEEDDPDGMNDPQSSRLKEGEKSKGHLYQIPGRRYKRVAENICGLGDRAQWGEKDKVHSQIYLQQLGKGKNVIGEDDGANSKAVVQSDNERLHQKPSQKHNWLIQYQNEHDDQARSVKKYKEKMGTIIKGKNMVKVEHEANKKTMVQIGNENLYQGRRNNWVRRKFSEHVDQQPGKKDVVHGQGELMKVGQGLSHQKVAFGYYSVKNEPDEGVKTRVQTEAVHNRIRGVKTSKCSVTYKNSVKNHLIKEGDVQIHPEVEILDITAFTKKGILSPFVPSTRYMMDDDFQDPGCPSAFREFKKEVLEVLRKPYDKEEYRQHREAIRVGSYLEHYPDLGKKLKKHRYKWKKRLTVLRGFFFWLENVTREGAFRPWKDRQCLAVEPGSP